MKTLLYHCVCGHVVEISEKKEFVLCNCGKKISFNEVSELYVDEGKPLRDCIEAIENDQWDSVSHNQLKLLVTEYRRELRLRKKASVELSFEQSYNKEHSIVHDMGQ